MKNKTKRNARANTIYVISVCSGHFYWARSIALQIYRIYVFWAEGARTEDVLWNLHVRRFFFIYANVAKHGPIFTVWTQHVRILVVYQWKVIWQFLYICWRSVRHWWVTPLILFVDDFSAQFDSGATLTLY